MGAAVLWCMFYVPEKMEKMENMENYEQNMPTNIRTFPFMFARFNFLFV